MKKIGFIDFFLDEWHANNYPKWIKESSVPGWEVTHAWAAKDAPAGLTSEAWCTKFGVKRCASVEEIIASCDALVVLSPNNPEEHEALCRLPLVSKKPVYVDKTFAPDLAAAERLFDLAKNGQTPMFSSSALRFAGEIASYKSKGVAQNDLHLVATRGGGVFEIYVIHQLEMIVSLMGPGAKRILSVGVPTAPAFVIDFGPDRRATLGMSPGPFQLALQHGAADGTTFPEVKGDFFPNLIAAMLRFFEDGKAPVPEAETLAIMALIDAAKRAVATPDTWVAVAS